MRIRRHRRRTRLVRPADSWWLVAWLLGFACASGPRQAPGGSSSNRAPRYLLYESPYRCADQHLDSALAASIERQRPQLAAVWAAPLQRIDTGQELLAELSRADPRPLVLLYVGHARAVQPDPEPAGEPDATKAMPSANVRRPGKTALCLQQGPLIVEDLLAHTHPSVAYAVLLLDACESADVDVRPSPVPAAVLSASPLPVTTTRAGRTALASDLIAALPCGDHNGDGWVDDGELLEALATIQPPVPTRTPLARLRRQSFHALPIVAATAPAACDPAPRRDFAGIHGDEALATLLTWERDWLHDPGRHARAPHVYWATDPEQKDLLRPEATAAPVLRGGITSISRFAKRLAASEGFALERRPAGRVVLLRLRNDELLTLVEEAALPELTRRVERGDWATVAADLRGAFLWHGGWVGGSANTLDGSSFAANQLYAVWCRGRAFGQCFELR